jgi:hypothetical protein
VTLEAFAADGSWLRCQLHAHTTNSDGEATTAGLVEHYARAGYDVLAITDHWHVTPFTHERLVSLLAAELSANVPGGFEADVLAYGIERIPEPAEAFPTIADAADWIVEHGGVPYLAHPYWSGLSAEHYLSAPKLAGIEVLNGGSERAQGNGLSSVHWDDILHRGGRCLGLGTDDSHYPGQDSRIAWTNVRAAERTPAAVLAALASGAFYASSGAEIHDLRRVDGGVEVRTSPARAVFLRSGPWDGCGVDADPRGMHWRGEIVERTADGAIVAARFETPEFWKWGRIEVRGRAGGRAWSNPFTIGTPNGGTA